MNKITLLFFFTFFLFCGKELFAQDEVYEPGIIRDTVESTAPTSKKEQKMQDKKDQKVKDDAKTDLEKKKEKLQRLRIGGSFGLQFGTFTYINISPTIGYMAIKDRLEVGAGPIFIYERYKYSSLDKISFFVYGPDIYTRGYLWKGIYLEARYDLVNKPSYYDFNRKIWVNHLLLGAGYAAPIGKIGTFNISALFNVLNNNESIYKGTFGNFPLILTFGFGFGLGGK
ncbi:MAG: hypothetical protein JWN78_1376 [Bacteroidota bacterium]|nr:hypothetical protein [Bacteroidota bacterium]